MNHKTKVFMLPLLRGRGIALNFICALGVILAVALFLFHPPLGIMGLALPFMFGLVLPEEEFRAEVLRAVGAITLAVSRKNGFQVPASHSPRTGLRSACESILAASAEKRAYLRAVFKYHCRASQNTFTPGELKLAKSTIAKALTQGADPGASLVSMEISQDIYSLMLSYGAWRNLGVIPVEAFSAKALIVTGKANAYWITKTNQGTAIPADIGVAGTALSDAVQTLAALVEVSNEALEDGSTTFEGGILQAIVEGLNFRLDWACMQADGTDDATDGGQTGIFADAAVPVKTAAAGKIALASLEFDDFADCIAAVTPSALQHPCRWFISPKFLPALLVMRKEDEYLLGRPQAPGEAWMLCGFPVEWTAAAPDTDGVGKPIAAFGRGDAYSVLLRQQFTISRSSDNRFAENLSILRATARSRCKMRDPSSFAILKTAAL